MKEIKCDSCGYRMTKKEYEDFPQCPDCYGSCVEEIEVRPVINGVSL